jgi:hypothetical protein
VAYTNVIWCNRKKATQCCGEGGERGLGYGVVIGAIDSVIGLGRIRRDRRDFIDWFRVMWAWLCIVGGCGLALYGAGCIGRYRAG